MRRKTEETISLTLAESDAVQDLENNNNTKSEKPQETFEYQGVYWARYELLFHDLMTYSKASSDGLLSISL